MSDRVEYKEKIAFHPGYYINEIIEDSKVTKEDFAKQLGMTPENLIALMNGEENLTADIAMKLSQRVGTSFEIWLNLQKTYDELFAEFESREE